MSRRCDKHYSVAPALFRHVGTGLNGLLHWLACHVDHDDEIAPWIVHIYRDQHEK